MHAAAVSRYHVVIQPRDTASRLRSSPMAGRATLREETVKGTRKEANEEIRRRIFFPERADMVYTIRIHHVYVFFRADIKAHNPYTNLIIFTHDINTGILETFHRDVSFFLTKSVSEYLFPTW